MATLFLAFLIILVSVAGLGVGLLLGRPPLTGSCGRLACGGCEKAGSGTCKRDKGGME